MLTIYRKLGWRTLLYLFAIVIGFSAEGYLLTAFQASKIVWSSTLILIIYVAIAGRGATALAYAWIICLFMFCIVARPWPVVWPDDTPLKRAQFWAVILLGLWLLTTCLIWLLAASSDKLNEYGLEGKARIARLGGLCWLSMGFGSLLYQCTSVATNS